MNEELFRERLPETWSVIQDGIGRKLHSGCQIYVSHGGTVIADGGIGQSSPERPMASETINVWLSSGKPLTAAAILQQWERGKLELDDYVEKYIPEFGVGGKVRITIRNLLTHTAGFRNVETGWPDLTWDESIRLICKATLESDWVVGRTSGYHTSSSWFILGEILTRVTGQNYQEAMRIELFEPAGLDEIWTANSPEQQALFAERMGKIYVREQGELQILDWNVESRVSRPSPGSSVRGPIRQLGRFYEMLLNRGKIHGRQILSPQTVEAMTARHRTGEFDLTLGHVVDFGLGVIVDSNKYGAETVPYGYGRHSSPRAFGHGGAQSSQGWCDPETGLVVAYVFNGRPGEGQHGRRTRQLNEAICIDLRLT